MYIPFNSILTYAKLYEFDEEQSENLIYFIKKMDDAQYKEYKKVNKK